MSDTTAPRDIYFFGGGTAEGGDHLKHLVGGKGASLAEMIRAGLNVPPGFTVSAECCDLYYKQGKRWPDGLESQLRDALGRLESLAGRQLGQGDDPLLVAVRSGAAHSMPGMMDTLLNVGLNPECVAAFAERTGDVRAAWAAYRDFLAMFGHTVAGIDRAVFDSLGTDPPDEDLCCRCLDAYRQHAGREMPDDPWEQLCAAVTAVFDSWMSERAVAYRAHHKIDGLLGTAVNVQMMCPSEVSGVMFTADPVNPTSDRMLIEASYGLGESVVLGKVEPDRFVLDRAGPRVVERSVSAKGHVVAALAAGGPPAATGDGASLTDEQLAELTRLGLKVEEFFGVPCDVEWGLSRGTFYLLQARAIKWAAPAVPDAEREQVRREEVEALQTRAAPGGTVWSRYNLSEILPEPTPMSWAVVRRFMSGRGGFGMMYRDLGFDPDPALDEDGIFDLVCGRPYCNLSREPRMQYRRLPFEHPFAALKAAPQRALYPQAVLNPARGGWRFWLLLPVTFFKLWRAAVRQRKLARDFADRFRKEIAPPFLREAAEDAARDWSKLDPPALLERFEHWRRRTLDEFGRESLKPTALTGLAMAALEQGLARYLQPAATADPTAAHLVGIERARAALRELVMGVRPDPDADLAGAVRDLAAAVVGGSPDPPTARAAFLKRFGHRGSLEMELSQPRWAEQPEALDRFLAAPGSRQVEKPADPDAVLERVAAEAGLNAAQRAALSGQLRVLHTYLGLRETAKDYLMRGYALIRRALVELDRRYGLDGGIFFLTPEELPGLVAAPSLKQDLLDRITARSRRRDIALSFSVPQVLFSDDLGAIGREVEAAGAEVLQGVPLSAGVAEGPALVLQRPADAPPAGEAFILVCPSTDPAWVPLFVRASGLVMETGGVLSHGAIVAREFGLPAVAGLPEVHRRIRTGQRLRVDGGTGRVNVLA